MNSKTITRLMEKARQTLKNSHSPYSKKKVACALITEDGRIFTGCNVENASFGATICAERTAIVKAVSEGAKKINGVLVMFQGNKPWPPCGMCRQVMLEFADLDCPVVVANHKGKHQIFTLGELCPHSFSIDQMKN